MDNIAARYFFGTGGNAVAIRQDGWSVDEAGFTWSIGTNSRLTVPLKNEPGPLALEISLNPMLAPPALRRQRLMLDVNGTRLADEHIGAEATLGVVLPPAMLESGQLDITLHHPQAQIPAELGISQDPRRLGFAVHDLILLREAPQTGFTRRTLPPLPIAAAGSLENAVRFLTALPVNALAAQFESLGRDTTLGLVQRAMGAEPPGLLRFAYATARRLVLALDAGFENLAARPNLFAFTREDAEDGEWMVRDATYLTEFHTGQFANRIDADTLLDQFAPHLAGLHRALLTTLETGAKIFVFQDPRAATPAQMRPLLTMLRAHGPNSLLFISADSTAPAGSVTQLEPGLFHGHAGQPAAGQAVGLDVWVSILANTYRMWREAGGGAR